MWTNELIAKTAEGVQVTIQERFEEVPDRKLSNNGVMYGLPEYFYNDIKLIRDNNVLNSEDGKITLYLQD